MEAREYTFIKYKIRKLLNIDLDAYKSAQVQRRLHIYLLRSGQPNWVSFFRSIENIPDELDRFKNYLTINVSSFFRDSEKFEYLRYTVLPDLVRGHPQLRVWSAGCSYGHEAYTLAILLSEVTGAYSRHYILATDIDRAALMHAQAGGPYMVTEATNVPVHLLKRYFQVRDGRYHVIESLKRNIIFRYHNLLADPFEKDFDLIVCRNVVIYFTAEAKNRLYQRFYDALRPGGVLFLGGTEVLSRPSELGFQSLGGISFFQRPSSGNQL